MQVHVNELLGGAETSAYLLKYDSVHGACGRRKSAQRSLAVPRAA